MLCLMFDLRFNALALVTAIVVTLGIDCTISAIMLNICSVLSEGLDSDWIGSDIS